MVDIADIPDPTPPAEYDRRRQERIEQEKADRAGRAQKSLESALRNVAEPSGTDRRLQSIEDKLDRILQILESKS